jgi:hypothetical protein
MNIFAVNSNPNIAAIELCDQHVVKMPIESAQMLSTAHRCLDGDRFEDRTSNGRRYTRWILSDERESVLYKSTMRGHPCTQWVMESLQNYLWLSVHALELCEEYTRRYDKRHGSQNVIEYLRVNYPKNMPNDSLRSPFAQAMPDHCRRKDAVEAYQTYYIEEKARFARWSKTSMPSWFEKKL